MCNDYFFFIINLKGVIDIISYMPFWETLKRKGISQYSLINGKHQFSTGTLDTMRKNESMTLNTVDDICMMLDCKISDVVEIIHVKEENKNY